MNFDKNDIQKLLQLLSILNGSMDKINKLENAGTKRMNLSNEKDTHYDITYISDIVGDNSEDDVEDVEAFSIIDYMQEFDTKDVVIALVGALCMHKIISADSIVYCLDEIDGQN